MRDTRKKIVECWKEPFKRWNEDNMLQEDMVAQLDHLNQLIWEFKQPLFVGAIDKEGDI